MWNKIVAYVRAGTGVLLRAVRFPFDCTSSCLTDFIDIVEGRPERDIEDDSRAVPRVFLIPSRADILALPSSD